MHVCGIIIDHSVNTVRKIIINSKVIKVVSNFCNSKKIITFQSCIPGGLECVNCCTKKKAKLKCNTKKKELVLD